MTTGALKARVRARTPARVWRALQAGRRRLAPPAVLEASWPWDTAQREIGPDPLSAAPASAALLERLDEEERAALLAALPDERRREIGATDPQTALRLQLAYGVHHGFEPLLARTALRADEPPPEVHAMARGPVAAGGSYYYADLVADALAEADRPLRAGSRALDFGCSSGRVVRVLAAAYPEVHWHGCDPIPDAIDWAAGHLPGIEFERSPLRPPLPYPDGAFDVVFAISIWSHFDEHAALEWIGEMRRILRPEGTLVMTAHGPQAVAFYAEVGERSREQREVIVEALHRRGFWYAPEFSARAEGDHGIVDPEWGTAFLSPEWALAKLTPEWRFEAFHPGRVENNQDLYVLARR